VRSIIQQALINTGGTKLERQEVRNCIFSGKLTKLLKELSEKEYFIKAIDNGVSPKRMKLFCVTGLLNTLIMKKIIKVL
jgi:hypothetical protein